MYIDSVHYSRKVSDGNYGNLELGMHAQVSEDEDASLAAANLRAFVDHLLAEHNNAATRWEEMQEDIERFERKRATKEHDFERMKKKWEHAKAFLEHHGLDTESFDDVPF